METAITKSELIEVLNTYITPLYQVIGATCAAFVLVLAVLLVIKPFLKRVR